MIKANELRIGNWVLDSGGKWLRVDYWEYHDKVAMKMFIEGTEVHPMTEYIQNASPIPITPDVLEKCGFVDFVYHWELGNIHLDWSSRIVATGERKGISVIGSPHIKYLHQLQNLVHALTGEELTVNL